MGGVPLFSFYRASGRNKFPAHLPSPVRAKERGACAVFTAPRAEISSPEKAAHLPSMARANERGPFGATGRKSARRRGPLIGLHR